MGWFRHLRCTEIWLPYNQTTISAAQHDLAKERIDKAGVVHKVELLLEDYRDLRGKYDKLVSIEMIEAVGHQYLDTFFRSCSNLLKENGMMLLRL